jgi:hypothetical protein
MNVSHEILSMGTQIQEELRQISLDNIPLSAVMICSGSTPLSDTQPIIDTEILSESVATSEIFRRAASVYTFRAMMGDSVPLDPSTQEDLDEGFRLLSKVPEYSFPRAHG